ncbi:hypothetical protein AB0I81_40195 [Nonomuraea sp. NPDC050404]|uniref:hypothetical protein n=1 Tax=Nonomuraea sp. NPDC050404 TaxID=3155783 RepID=UPI00340972A3
MARTALTPAIVGAAGLNLADTAVAAQLTDGNSFPWAPRRHAWVSNGDDAVLTVTVPTPGTVGPLALPIGDATFAVPAGEALLLPVLGQECRQSDGTVHLNYTGTTPTSVTVAVVDT